MGGIHLFEIGPDQVARCDDGLRALFGVLPTARFDHAVWLTRLHPADRDRLAGDFERLMREGGSTEIEYRVLRPDGSIRRLLSRAQVTADPGRPGSVFGVTMDVTEQREAVAALAASKEAARLAAERVQLALDAGAIIGTWVWDVPTDTFTADERFARSFNLDPEECRTGLGLDKVAASIHPDDKPRVMEAVAQALGRGGLYRCEYRVRQSDSVYRWIEANGRVDLAPDGTPLRFPGVLLDIERRHVMEGERDRATALLRTFAEAVPGVVYAKDRQGRMLLANEGTSRLVGRPSEEFLGRTDAEFLNDKRQAEAVMANDQRIMQSGVAEQVEERVNMADGTPAVWLSTKAPLRDASGNVIGLVGTSIDITGRKQAETSLVDSRAELERLVDERTRDLQVAQARLAHAQRMEALGQLAGGVAHDFNNVLQAVRSGAALIRRRAADADVVRHLARMVTDATARGSAVTQRLLAFSRRSELRAEPLDAVRLLESTQEILSHTLGAGVEIRVETACDLAPLLADKGQLETVLVNLATNARDAMNGAGTLTLKAQSEVLARGMKLDHPVNLEFGSYVRLSVSDTGCGMDAETLVRASEPFFTTKEPGKGTGLGLAMARGFAEQSGGGLHIGSEPGRGTTVALWLPVANVDAVVGIAPALGDAPSRASGRRILLVDDEDLVREMLARELSERGHDVVQARDAETALALLDAGEAVDALISDLSMPRMNGVALIDEAQRRRPGLGAILLTGYAGGVEPGASKAGECGYSLLRKPVSGDDLARCVTELLMATKGD
ncbi:PAS domain-containing protein [Belnapia sp. T18]|uniref:histidine kinase n=1 Tax=Belnapia arida TaxID=2804533 RepID=A0ABS1U7P1_9PROT|nr:PAS domain-containing protein [Belnapia arida]MBL6080668.1 PAS domain-containing protein [Belnapia arida]